VNVGRIVGGSADFVEALGANAGLVGTSRQLNAVPERAVAEGEFRYLTAAEGAAAGADLEALASKVASDHGVSMTFTVGAGIPPVDPHGPGAGLVRRVVSLAAARGLRLDVEEDRGGVSFPNFLAEPGRIPVVDGLGPVGEGMHTRDEWLDLRSLERRIVLFADVLAALEAR
jgi:glutamate carboxypeptidase